ncbi:MAG: lysine--tRNA ligase [Dehalococcoidia bacterium]|nr:lysine--tRNA ligase [Dehalococcoidia bacterium]
MAERNDEFYQQRLSKLQALRAQGLDPYPSRFERTHTAVEAAAYFAAFEAEHAGEHTEETVTLAGRITALRVMGKATFMDIRDGTGKLQAYFRADHLPAGQFQNLKELDLGDFVGVTGNLFRTRTGEVTLGAHHYAVLAKSLQPPPEKWHGLTDTETRYRHRYLDLMSSEEVRQTFITRSRVVATMRRFLDDRGFLEVETPMLQPQAGGAMARPFVTHYNALDQQFYLRIATELHLKRLIVGGLEKVYEIGRIFRNEGISTKHNPEFTTLESYEAYASYLDVMAMVEDMVSHIARTVLGATEIPYKEGTINLTPPWRRITLRDAIQERSGIDFLAYRETDALAEAMRSKGHTPPAGAGFGKLVDELLSNTVERHLMQPAFLTEYPVELSPLAKRMPENARLVERFEAFVGGMEIANAFSELNDPVEQRARFSHQAQMRALGDDEAELPDEDFLFALEHGMPPTGGLGMGIDRLAMLLTGNASIREVILFPQLRRRE